MGPARWAACSIRVDTAASRTAWARQMCRLESRHPSTWQRRPLPPRAGTSAKNKLPSSYMRRFSSAAEGAGLCAPCWSRSSGGTRQRLLSDSPHKPTKSRSSEPAGNTADASAAEPRFRAELLALCKVDHSARSCAARASQPCDTCLSISSRSSKLSGRCGAWRLLKAFRLWLAYSMRALDPTPRRAEGAGFAADCDPSKATFSIAKPPSS
jgi:hypothetical protein